MNWKSLARKTNSLPPGWSTAEDISADLDCEPSEVPKILASAIRDGLVEKQNFPHWQPGSRQLLYQTGYRQKTGKVVSEKSPQISDKTATQKISGIPAHLMERVRKTCIRYRSLRPGEIAARCRWRGEQKIPSSAINAMLDTLTHN